ncbi:hypothetical protein Tco_0496682 [Tanacetum coccineum]
MKCQLLNFKGTEGVVELTQCKIKKLKVEMWDLKVKGTDVIGYNQRYQELALMCVRMFPKESDKVKKYVGGLPDMLHGSVVASKPKTMQNVAQAYVAGIGERKEYARTLPLCNKCKFHHNGVISRSYRTRTMETRLKVLEHVDWCMP